MRFVLVQVDELEESEEDDSADESLAPLVKSNLNVSFIKQNVLANIKNSTERFTDLEKLNFGGLV